MAEFLVQQYLLHTAPYKETSALVTGLSMELGKVRFVAKGIRSEKNKYKGLAQTFTLLSTKLIGKGDLKSGVAMETLETTISLTGTALFCAMYCNEVLVRILPLEEPCPDVFKAYQLVLNGLSENNPPEPILRSFELFLLQELGAEYDFYYDCISNQRIDPALYYQFVLEQGFYACEHFSDIKSPDTKSPDINSPGTKGPKSNGSKTKAFKGAELLAIAEQSWTPESLQAAKRFCRLALAPWIGRKPIKSRELFVRQS